MSLRLAIRGYLLLIDFGPDPHAKPSVPELADDVDGRGWHAGEADAC